MKKFDEIINKKIAATEIKPSAELWNKIDARLTKDASRKIFVLPMIGTSMFKNAIAASVIFLLGASTAFYFLNNNNNNIEIVNNKTNSIDESNLTRKTNHFQNKTDTKSVASKENLAEQEKSNSPQSGFFSSVNNKSKTASNSLYKSKNTEKSNATKNMSASDYVWIYDKVANAYSVYLKDEQTELKQNNLLAELDIPNSEETSYMSILEKKETSEKFELFKVKNEVLDLDVFITGSNKINYKGLWLGPNIGFESIFSGEETYYGGSFGLDVGYDFGGSWGMQSGIKYVLSNKNIQTVGLDGTKVDYRSEMNSFHIPLLLKYKITSFKKSYARPLSLNLVGGVDYAFTEKKKLHQLGLNLGVEYDIFTQADLMLTLGLRGGLYNNVNFKKMNVPENIGRYNYGINAYFALRFIDWAKKTKED